MTVTEVIPVEPGSSSPNIRVLIADDHEVVRLGTRLLIQADDVTIVGEVKNGKEAVAQAERLAPDIILMDLLMPEMDGIEATRLIHQKRPQTQIVLLTGLEDEDRVLAAVRAGAAGYLSKNGKREDYLAAIRQVHRGDPYLPPAITRRILGRWVEPRSAEESVSLLTQREKEILREVGRGLDNRQVADHLCISEVTVRTHIKNIYLKLDLTNRVELALHSLRLGLVSLNEAQAS